MHTRSARVPVTALLASALALLSVACGAGSFGPSTGSGTVELPLGVSAGADLGRLHLVDATFVIRDNMGLVAELTTENHAGAVLRAPIDAGTYTIELLGGWTLLLDAGDGNLQYAGEFEVASQNPQTFTVNAGRSTHISYSFARRGSGITVGLETPPHHASGFVAVENAYGSFAHLLDEQFGFEWTMSRLTAESNDYGYTRERTYAFGDDTLVLSTGVHTDIADVFAVAESVTSDFRQLQLTTNADQTVTASIEYAHPWTDGLRLQFGILGLVDNIHLDGSGYPVAVPFCVADAYWYLSVLDPNNAGNGFVEGINGSGSYCFE